MSDDFEPSTDDAEAPPPPPKFPAYHDETGKWSSGELLRLIITPTLVTVLLVGGVYWIRSRPPTGSAGQQQLSMVQVHLLPRPDPTPIESAAKSQSITDQATNRVDAPSIDPSPATADDPLPSPRATTFSTADLPPSNIRSAPSPLSGAPSSAALKFQEALLRHVGRYQRYPNAARAQHLEGKVDTQFAISRDGTLLGVWVRTSSGQPVLDREAIETIRRAQPLPPIPPELPDRLNIHVQLAFDPG
jgi:periplasmic protein TonB